MQVIWQGKALPKLPGLNQPFTLLWRWCPSTDPLRMCMTLDNPEIQAEGHVTYIWPRHVVALADTELRIRLRDYAFRYKGFPISVSGDGKFKIDDLKHEPGKPLPDSFSVDGTITSLRNKDIPLGDYQVNSRFDATQLNVDIKGGTEIFSVKATAKLDLSGRRSRYRYSADLSSENKILLAALKMYAQNAGKGKVTFSGSGVCKTNARVCAAGRISVVFSHGLTPSGSLTRGRLHGRTGGNEKTR